MIPRVTAHAVRLVHRRTMENGWVVSVFSVPESERDKRRATDDGDPTRVWNGCTRGWIAPGHLTSETREVLERRGLATYVEIFEGQHVAFGSCHARNLQLDETGVSVGGPGGYAVWLGGIGAIWLRHKRFGWA